MTDPVDEYLTQNLTEYEEKKFQNASKDDLKLGSKDEKAKFKEIKESYKELTKWWKDLLSGEMVEAVKVGSVSTSGFYIMSIPETESVFNDTDGLTRESWSMRILLRDFFIKKWELGYSTCEH